MEVDICKLRSLNTFRIKINDIDTDKVDHIRYLGVVIDKHLEFKEHVKYITNKMTKKVNLLYRIGRQMSVYIMLRLYKALIVPHLQFCSTVLWMLNKGELQQLQKVQNRAMRVILKCNRYTPINTMLNTLNIMNVNQLVTYRTLIFIHKIKLGSVPEYLGNRIQYVGEIHNHYTRNTNNFFIQPYNREKTTNSIFVGGIALYNELPGFIKDSENLNTFKRLVIKYVLDKY